MAKKRKTKRSRKRRTAAQKRATAKMRAGLKRYHAKHGSKVRLTRKRRQKSR